jgi:sulfopyruvate decarboxylase TPP-binding subunit
MTSRLLDTISVIETGRGTVAKGRMQLFGEKIFEEFKKCGITHIVWLPCFQLGFIYDVMMKQSEIELVPVCREGEGVAVAAGLALGGKKPIVLYQNTGIYESGDSMRMVTFELHVPLLIMLGYRGWKGTDSAGVVMEPTMDAWQVNYHVMKSVEDVGMISLADEEAQEARKPVAILVVGEEP